MAINGIFYVFAHVSDLARSKRFYGETLGWKLSTDERDVAGFAFGSGYLVIHAETRAATSAGYAGGMHVGVRVDDVDAEHARLKNIGVKVGELHDHPWGERNFELQDPDGYTWSYGQAIRER